MRASSVAALLVALVLASCTTGTPDDDASAGPTTPAVGPGEPPAPGSAWEDAVGARLDDEGRVPLDLALDMFAAAYGDLPGGDPDTLPTPVSGTSAVRAVLAHWDALDDEQRTAVTEALEPGPDVHVLADGAGADAEPDVLLAAHVPTGSREEVERTHQVGAVLDEMKTLVSGFLGLRGGWTISWSMLPDSPESRHAAADATPWGDTGLVRSGKAKTCHVNLYADALEDLRSDPSAFRTVMAHEVAHCAQFLHADVRRVFEGIQWVVEGGAEYVAAHVAPSAALDPHWNHWLGLPAYALTAREYSGIGVFAVAEQTGADVPAAVIPALAERGSAAALARLFGTSADDARRAIARAVVRLPELGPAWESTGPAITTARGTRDLDPRRGTAAHVTPVGRLAAVPVTTRLGPEVTMVTVAGAPASVGWTGGGTELADGGSAAFCVAGRCTCPDGLPLRDAVELPADARVGVAVRSEVPTTVEVTARSTDLAQACSEMPATDVLVMRFTAPEVFEVHGGWCLVQSSGDLLVQAGDGRYPEGYDPPPAHRDDVTISIYKNPTSRSDAGTVLLSVGAADVGSNGSQVHLSTDRLSGRFSTGSGYAGEWRCAELVDADEFFAR